MYNTEDIKQQLIAKYKAGDFRVTKTGVKTVELQNVQFECDKDYIIREPNYDYASREIEWYESQSLNVNDIQGKTPAIWEQCADVNGEINKDGDILRVVGIKFLLICKMLLSIFIEHVLLV